MRKNIKENTGPTYQVPMDDKGKQFAKETGQSNPNATVMFYDPNKPPKSSSSSSTSSNSDVSGGVSENETIEPKDKETIKYLSNVIDNKTGELSKPFTIADKRYQMVRGRIPSKQVVLAVFCHDDFNDIGDNIIQSIDEFEKNVINPMQKKQEKDDQIVNPEVEGDELILGSTFGDDLEIDSKKEPEKEHKNNYLGLSEFRHYLVNEKTGKFRKFKGIGELAAAVMNEDEKYMPLKEFRKFFDEMVFGGKKSYERLDEAQSPAPVKQGVPPVAQPPAPVKQGVPPVAQPVKQSIATPAEEDPDFKLKNQVNKFTSDMIKKVPSMDLNKIANGTPIVKKQAILTLMDILNVEPAQIAGITTAGKELTKTKQKSGVENQSITKNTTVPIAGGQALGESKILTKIELMKSLNQPKIIKTIKIKDIK